mmetsp:Transcript_12280/g.20631  ORF Transcript_12280/g.20631 Transcript_12280/m.20631 type:complete len:233 (+) Transcript_12280:597-1295(+)
MRRRHVRRARRILPTLPVRLGALRHHGTCAKRRAVPHVALARRQQTDRLRRDHRRCRRAIADWRARQTLALAGTPADGAQSVPLDRHAGTRRRLRVGRLQHHVGRHARREHAPLDLLAANRRERRRRVRLLPGALELRVDAEALGVHRRESVRAHRQQRRLGDRQRAAARGRESVCTARRQLPARREPAAARRRRQRCGRRVRRRRQRRGVVPRPHARQHQLHPKNAHRGHI